MQIVQKRSELQQVKLSVVQRLIEIVARTDTIAHGSVPLRQPNSTLTL